MIAPLLFRGLSKSEGLTVLDLGAASSATVEFFSSYKCRIDFVDLLNELDNDLLAPDADQDALRSRLQELIGDTDAPAIDVCLFWDTLNYLPAHALKLFNECLAPRVRSTTRAHGFGVRYSTTPMLWAEHGFRSQTEIASRAKPAPERQAIPHTPSQFNKILSALHVNRAILLRDGRLELLLTPAPAEPPPT